MNHLSAPLPACPHTDIPQDGKGFILVLFALDLHSANSLIQAEGAAQTVEKP